MKKGIITVLILCAVLLFGGIIYMMNRHDTGDAAQAVRTVTDSTGAEVSIPVHPQRVIFLNVSNMDMYIAAGGLDTIAGRPTSTSMSPELAQQVSSIPEVGIIHSPNIEKILSLKPDLVIGVNVPFHNNIRETLAQNHIPLYINTLDTYEDTMKTLKFYGELTGKEAQAQQEADAIEQQCQAILTKVRGKEGPRSLIVFSTPGSNNMATSATFSGSMLKQLGGVNIADADSSQSGQFVPLSMEYVVKQDPQAVFIISMGNSPDKLEQFKNDMQTNDAWSQIDAVRNGRIYILPMDLFTVNPGSRIGEAMTYLANCLYPEDS